MFLEEYVFCKSYCWTNTIGFRTCVVGLRNEGESWHSWQKLKHYGGIFSFGIKTAVKTFQRLRGFLNLLQGDRTRQARWGKGWPELQYLSMPPFHMKLTSVMARSRMVILTWKIQFNINILTFDFNRNVFGFSRLITLVCGLGGKTYMMHVG